ncbi:endonuclease G [Algoriphagus aquaeductus]|uniref:Endonuclease G n=1 Tax=Algoriphagus aquaeductus TaxID=475299 RepID=A0A326RLV7_9BACT|nr:DNA/RNA non-specific endonuclease [Algoriphagus aquaeductus]PZV76016.1 endonuclease G [Algoriphagus aquaeductus]
MKIFLILFFVTMSFCCLGQDSLEDHSKVSEFSKSLEHLLPLFTIHGTPKYQNREDTLIVLINHGYILGFSPRFNQPLWAAYQVSKSKKEVDYERYPFFVDDMRLNLQNRIGTQTFGNGYDLGHLAPNAAINKQYAKMSQMETFLMSNICPQKAELNRGVWQKLEEEILNKYPYSDRANQNNHLWVLVGPVFSDNPEFIIRPNGSKIAIPDAFFCILARPKTYPFDSPGNADYLAFLFPQEVARNQKITRQFLTSINEIERLTKLNFFPNLSRLMEDRIENTVASDLW